MIDRLRRIRADDRSRRALFAFAAGTGYTSVATIRLHWPPAASIGVGLALAAFVLHRDELRRRKWLHGLASAAAATVAAISAVQAVWGPPPRLIAYGVAIGSLYGLLAMGLVLVYRSHRIVNFAAGSMGAVPAVLALTLMTTHGLSWFLALPLALVCGAAAGGGTHATVVRRFSRAPRLLLTVVTIGLSQLFAYLAFRVPVWLGATLAPPTIRTPFTELHLCRPDSALGPLSRACHRFLKADDLNGDLVFAMLVVAAISLGLAAFFRRTRIGIARRAAAEDAERAALLGIPVATLSTLAWSIAGTLAAAAIFLRAPLVGLPLGGLAGPGIILFALAAAIVARMESMPVALVAGIAMGIVDQSAVFASGRAAIATATTLPIVLFALALQRPRTRRAREASTWQTVQTVRAMPAELARLTEVRAMRVALAIAVVMAVLLAPWVVGPANTGFATLVVITAVVAVSLVVLTGWGGQISLGQYGFVGIGSLVAGALAGNYQVDFFVTLAAGTLAGGVIAAAIGFPAARLPGLFQAVATLAFGAAVELYVLNPDFPIGRALLPKGANRISRPTLWQRFDLSGETAHRLFGIDLSGERPFYFVCLAVFGLVLVSVWSFHRHRSARVVIAVRDNPDAAASYGVHPGRTRLAAFVFSGSLAGLAGVLLAYQQGAIDAATYSSWESIGIFAVTVVGGIGSVAGAVVASVGFEGLKLVERSGAGFQNLSLLATGPGLVLVLLALPGGLADAARRVQARWFAFLARIRGIETHGAWDDDGRTRTPRLALVPTSGRPAVLGCRDLKVSYGNVPVLFGVDLEIRESEIVALLGTNGAGKSTVLRAISGLVRPSGGSIALDGSDVTGVSAAEMAARGVVHMPGGKAVFPSLSVADHFRLALWLTRDGADEKVDRAVAEFPRLRARWDQPAGNLSGGEQQMLGLAMVLVTNPGVLLIDELSLGLDAQTVARLLDVVRKINERGTAIVIVEQSLDVAASIAHRAYFLEKGTVRFMGRPSELLERPDVARSVFLAAGNGHRAPSRQRPRRVATPVLEIRGLRKRFGGIVAVDGVDIDVPADRIVGIIGPNGSGKTTIFDLVSGHLSPDEGRIVFEGVDVTEWGAERRAIAGLGRSFQDSRTFPSLTAAGNVAVGGDRHVACRDHLASALSLPAAHVAHEQTQHNVDRIVSRLGLQSYGGVPTAELSTGTRHIVDLGMALAHRPSVLLLDEPSSGIAQKETEALAPLLKTIQRELGCAMLVIEHDIGLLSAVADEIIALENGRIIARGTPRRLLRNKRVARAYMGRRG